MPGIYCIDPYYSKVVWEASKRGCDVEPNCLDCKLPVCIEEVGRIEARRLREQIHGKGYWYKVIKTTRVKREAFLERRDAFQR